MFVHLANHFTQNAALGFKAADIFSLHPLQIMAFLDAVWEAGRATSVVGSLLPHQPNAGIGGPVANPPGAGTLTLRDDLLRALSGPYKDPDGQASNLGGDLFATAVSNFISQIGNNRHWDHLIYAYCIENTRVYEVCNKLLVELIHGERLGSLSAASHRWVRSTEELFFRDSMPSLIASLVSSVRPDIRATRRNAYYRMFAMDLNHGAIDNSPYPYRKSDSSNQAFVTTFESLLREIWRGYVNAANTSGPNTTDNSVIAELCRRLREMMSERRRNGALSREEFVAVASMSWFHLTVSSNTPVVVDLKADSSTPEERLRRLGERVGVGTHSRARSFFTLADPLAHLLADVELGKYDAAADTEKLYDPSAGGNVTADTLTIIHHWSVATGRDLKAPVVIARSR